MSDNLREIPSHCEAKLHGFRRTQEGVVVSFVLNPVDVPPVLALDPLGTRYMLALVAIGDDEQPVTPSRRGDGERPANGGQSPGMHSGGGASLSRPGAANSAPRGSFSVGEPTGMGGASDGRRDKTPAERAVIRAALLPKDERFRAWVTGQRYGRDLVVEVIVSEDQAADFIREHCCGGKSRKLIGEVPEYMGRFRTMLTEFQIAVGEMAAPR